jgi:cytoskeletal protein CcmA (bactofilin family)
MFSRNADRPVPPGSAPVPGARDVSQPQMPPPPVLTDATVIARADRVEGTLRVADVVRVLGSVEGRIEAATLVVEEGARVNADVVADEVVIAGEYHGKLICRQRLEVRASGRVSGLVETFRLMLHEGAAVDGEVKMLKDPGLVEAEAIRSGSVRGPAAEAGIRGGTFGQGGAPPAPPRMPPGPEPIG